MDKTCAGSRRLLPGPWWLVPFVTSLPIVLVGLAFLLLQPAKLQHGHQLHVVVATIALALLAFSLTARLRTRLAQPQGKQGKFHFTTRDLLFWMFVVALLMTVVAAAVHFPPMQPIAPRP